jgi:transposase
MCRPTMRFVSVKTAEQQAALRSAYVDRLIRNRAQLSNAIGGYAGEFGLAAAKRKAHLDPLLNAVNGGGKPGHMPAPEWADQRGVF